MNDLNRRIKSESGANPGSFESFLEKNSTSNSLQCRTLSSALKISKSHGFSVITTCLFLSSRVSVGFMRIQKGGCRCIGQLCAPASRQSSAWCSYSALLFPQKHVPYHKDRAMHGLSNAHKFRSSKECLSFLSVVPMQAMKSPCASD